MITATVRPAPAVTELKGLISPDLLDRLVSRIVREKQMSVDQAERILIQTLAFLKVCALNPGAGLAPSRAVDTGWHHFILYTDDYTEFCHRVAGRFIHHMPDDQDTGNGGASIRATVAAMEEAGLPVDLDMWERAADCSQCYQGCHDSPRTV